MQYYSIKKHYIKVMNLGYILFDGITWLDFIGVYDPISRLKTLGYLPDLQWDCCAFTPTVKDHLGLTLIPTHVQTSLSSYDVIIVPGGKGTRTLISDQDFMGWLSTASSVLLKISICTGSLLLGAAGFLKNKKATTHFSEYDTLKPYCAQVVQDRVVEDHGAITAGAVASSLDLGLYLCEKWAGKAAALDIQKRMDYHPA